MKKLTVILIIAICSVAFAVSQIEPTIEKTVKKINDKTLEVTTVTTSTNVAEFDKAVLQTELDHISDRRAELQKQMDAIDEREAELIELLAIFK